VLPTDLILPGVHGNDAEGVMGSFRETASRKTAENTVKHRNGGVALVVANNTICNSISVLINNIIFC